MDTILYLSKPRRPSPRHRVGPRSLKATRVSLEDTLERLCADIFGVVHPVSTGGMRRTVARPEPALRS